MGRSTSCFKIITCAGDSADNDDLQVPPENKSSNDRRGWSFRKRSARHRVLSNTVITEASFSANKESSESASLNFPLPETTTAPEKISVIQCTDEKPQLSAVVDSKEAETIVVTTDKSEVEGPPEESVIIAIQTAVRGFLARRELLKRKNLVKLQAVVRGHLVRQHAIGTLRCVQAIVKMQALVRARHARLLQEGSSSEKKADGKHEKVLGKENSLKKPDITYTSMNKLLGNSFARQLMESTPKSRPIHIKCDSSKPNSAWNWLERWMSVSSAEPTPQPNLKNEEVEIEKKDENLSTVAEAAGGSESVTEPADSSSCNKETVHHSETEEKLVAYGADDSEFQEQPVTSSISEDNLEHTQVVNISPSDTNEDIKSHPSQTVESNENYITHKVETEVEQTDQPKRSMKRNASEQLETDGKKFVYGSRKVSNPSFIAAQSIFEELSSTVNSSKPVSVSYQDGGVESNADPSSSPADTLMRTKEINGVGHSGPNNLRAQYGDSECGTELSVTSTLDSPDIFEVGAGEYGHEAKLSEKEACSHSSTTDIVIEAKDESTDPIPTPSEFSTDQMEKPDTVKDEYTDSVVTEDPLHVESMPERSASDVQRESYYSETGAPAYRSSPEASPRSHMTVPESQGTPSSQVSVKTKRNRTNRSASDQKRRSLSGGKKSPSNSGARSSVEQLPKDQKNGKRRNSFGSTRPENADEEPRDSSSSSSLPHFMQATESARAKLQANSSPRSSPDVQDRDYVKKRHSLPASNGRQISPSAPRSSQTQASTKGNSGHIVHEKKWQR